MSIRIDESFEEHIRRVRNRERELGRELERVVEREENRVRDSRGRFVSLPPELISVSAEYSSSDDLLGNDPYISYTWRGPSVFEPKEVKKVEKRCANPTCHSSTHQLYKVLIKTPLNQKNKKAYYCGKCISRDSEKLVKVFLEKTHKKKTVKKSPKYIPPYRRYRPNNREIWENARRIVR